MLGLVLLLSVGVSFGECWTAIAERGVTIPYQLSATPLQILTNSSLGSGDIIYVQFKADFGNKGRTKPAGGFTIQFKKDSPAFKISYCSWTEWTPFTLPAGAGNERTWTITKEEETLTLACQGVQIVKYTFAGSDNYKCEKFWASTAAMIKFTPGDSASVAYREAQGGDFVCYVDAVAKEIGEVWDVQATCETCTCVAAHTAECNATVCDECPEGQVPVKMDGDCCPICITDWVRAEHNETHFTADVGDSVVLWAEIYMPVFIEDDSLYWEKKRESNLALAVGGDDKYEISEDGLALTLNSLKKKDAGVYRLRACYDKDTCDTVRFYLDVNPSSALTMKPSTSVL